VAEALEALAQASKNGTAIHLNRETGSRASHQEMPGDRRRRGCEQHRTERSRSRLHRAGTRWRRFSPTVARTTFLSNNWHRFKQVPAFTPPGGPNQIVAPGNPGGANYSRFPTAHRPDLQLRYVDAVDQAQPMRTSDEGHSPRTIPHGRPGVAANPSKRWPKRLRGDLRGIRVVARVAMCGYGGLGTFRYDARRATLLWKVHTALAGLFAVG